MLFFFYFMFSDKASMKSHSFVCTGMTLSRPCVNNINLLSSAFECCSRMMRKKKLISKNLKKAKKEKKEWRLQVKWWSSKHWLSSLPYLSGSLLLVPVSYRHLRVLDSHLECGVASYHSACFHTPFCCQRVRFRINKTFNKDTESISLSCRSHEQMPSPSPLSSGGL